MQICSKKKLPKTKKCNCSSTSTPHLSYSEDLSDSFCLGTCRKTGPGLKDDEFFLDIYNCRMARV